jgi:hypothetical protein
MEEFEPTLAELNTVTSEENTMMDISNITDYISPENMQQLDLLISAAQQSFSSLDNPSGMSDVKPSSRDRGRHSSASEVPRTWTVTSPSQDDTPVFSRETKLPNYQRQPLDGQRMRHSSASSYSSKPPQKSNLTNSTLHKLLSRTTQPVTVVTAEHTVPASVPSQLSPGKRKLPFPKEESNSVDRKWEEIKQLLYSEEKESVHQKQTPAQKQAPTQNPAPSQPKCKRQSLGE